MAARIKYTREVLEAAVASSLSMREALKKAGAKNLAGSTHAYISKRLRSYGISTAHFVGQKWSLGTTRTEYRKPASKILLFHPDERRQDSVHLSRSLLEIGREYKCYICGLHSWRHKRIVLEIEHKDGDFQNDRSENIEFICPNCHSQTETFCRGPRLKEINERKERMAEERKNRKERNHPSFEGYWRTKDKPHLRKVERPEPGELQSLMQTMPMIKIGEKFGVSDNAVRKWIRRYGLEMPKLFGRSRGSKDVRV